MELMQPSDATISKFVSNLIVCVYVIKNIFHISQIKSSILYLHKLSWWNFKLYDIDVK